MVGTTGFEPATSRTPSVRATRLRYVPTVGADCCSPPMKRRKFFRHLMRIPRLKDAGYSTAERITRIREPSTRSGASPAGRAGSCG